MDSLRRLFADPPTPRWRLSESRNLFGFRLAHCCVNLGRTIMVRNLLTWGAALSALAVLTPCEADAQVENLVPPAGAMMWHYECQPGTQCPTKCMVKGTDLFSTGNYVSLTILQIPNQVYWFRIDTGQTNVDYVAQADQVICSVVGAMLKSARAQESGKSTPAARP
jgi:hypothetical protein